MPFGVVAGDKVGQAGVEAAFDDYLRGDARRTTGCASTRSASPRGQSTPALAAAVRATPSGSRSTCGCRRRRSSALAYGIQRARDSNCYGCWDANGGAIVALDPHDGSVLALASAPTYNPGVYSGRVTTKALAAQGLTPATAQEKNYPGAQPRARRRLSAGLDVQAGHGARRDAGASRLAVRARWRARARTRRRTTAGTRSSRTGTRTSTGDRPADGARDLVRHVLLPARRRRSTSCRASAAIRCRRGQRASASAADRHRRRPRGRRPAADARVAAADVHAKTDPAAGASTASGSRATRSSSRSGRRTCSSRRCRWRASTR